MWTGKSDSNTLGVDAHFNFILFLFLKHGDKFLCFQKNPDTVWTGPKTKKKKDTKTPFMCERKAET